MKLITLFTMVFFVLHIQPTVSQTVKCYTTFSLNNGTCHDVLGEVPFDDCCMNPKYGYEEDGVCKSCRYPEWSTWSEWSDCSVTCLPGVQQRRRECYGIGKCEDPYKRGKIQTKPCTVSACCPENGGWSVWSPWLPCSVTCEKGIKMRNRICNNPAPKCGGTCLGNENESAACDTGTVCPTHGEWSSWSSWDPCMATCQQEGSMAPNQERHRTCTNPSPSIQPQGNDCQGPRTDRQPCTGLPFCPVNGNWGGWSPSSECSVTCGVGRQKQYRKCDNPAPKYGGRHCRGDDTKVLLCTINTHCPVDGHWSEWASWTNCKSPNDRSITCRNRQGTQRRERDCLGTDYDGEACPGEGVEHRTCYDITDCDLGGLWSGWSSWGFCTPDCGENSIQTRKKECIPDISTYKIQNLEIFSGTPNIDCPPLDNDRESRECLNLPKC
ncbi:properdin-like [Hoplias malabaricus]|uniref:properdin-like n=1 Tax=Hoplias malabaricus TaxID=27720 RepID=UPI003462ABE9